MTLELTSGCLLSPSYLTSYRAAFGYNISTTIGLLGFGILFHLLIYIYLMLL